MAKRSKTRRAIPCPYRSAAAHRRADNCRSRALYAECVQELVRAGGAHAFDGAVRGAEIARLVASRMEAGEASATLQELQDRFEAFVRFARRNSAWIAAQIAAEKENAHHAGAQ